MSSLDPNDNLHCRYCVGFLAENAEEKSAIWNRAILESKNFVVVPTLGQFIPGWLLVVSKLHYSCLGELPSSLHSEFHGLWRDTKSLVHSLYGASIEFEHGACTPNNGSACVQHLHLHVVACSLQVNAELRHIFAGKDFKGLAGLQEMFQEKKPYLVCSDSTGEMVFETPLIPSQYMRKYLAVRLGLTEKYDWREYAGEQEIRSFLLRAGKVTGDNGANP